MSTQLLLDVAEASHALGMIPRRLTRLANTGRIPVVRLPDGEPRFEVEALKEWVAKHRVAARESEAE